MTSTINITQKASQIYINQMEHSVNRKRTALLNTETA